jgi:NAD-dependent dihydropyrimidine dehydrogenase PreA subunit
LEFLSTFEVPTCARPVLGAIVLPEEVLLVASLTSREFTADDAHTALEGTTGEPWSASHLDAFLDAAYRRGVLDVADEGASSYIVSTFYARLGVFVISEPDSYRALPAETRSALDSWYLDAYVERLGADERPSSDIVLPLKEALLHLDTVAGQIWLNPCDCRTLAGTCDKPLDTCVSFANGINTLSHRGWSKPLTREEAKAVVTKADADGLMHTVSDHAICNCCSDCCYLFRAQAARDSGPAVWPRAEKIVNFNLDACIACGRCLERCPFDAFSEASSGVVFDESRCRGCGLCVETCPTGAIELGERVGGA